MQINLLNIKIALEYLKESSYYSEFGWWHAKLPPMIQKNTDQSDLNQLFPKNVVRKKQSTAMTLCIQLIRLSRL